MSNTPLAPTTDFYGVFANVDGRDLEFWQTAEKFGREEILPVIDEYWEKAEYPLPLVARLAELGLLIDGVDIEGVEHQSPLATGLVEMEISRYDGSVATALAVQMGLAARTIANLGSQEQKDKYLVAMHKGEIRGSFGLTEPDHGSDSIALETSAKKVDGGWILNGEKRWIGQGSVGHITNIFARMENGQVGGFIVPQDAEGYHAETIVGKMALRAIPQAHITLTDCFVPDENQLPGCQSFRDVAKVLMATRVSVAWSALGQAITCYEVAREHAFNRVQFGEPLINRQMIQQRLANMLIDTTQMMLLCRELAAKQEAGTLTEQEASLAKVNNTRKARAIAADARDLLGGNGILLENRVGRHFADIETLHTYEGTDTMQSLIIGKKISGVGAYK